jgi:hypothetical protein
MRARDAYELRHEPAPKRGTVWRILSQFLALIVVGPSPGGGDRVLIIDRRTGGEVGHVRQRSGDDFYSARLEEDLLTMSADDFTARWLDLPPR